MNGPNTKFVTFKKTRNLGGYNILGEGGGWGLRGEEKKGKHIVRHIVAQVKRKKKDTKRDAGGGWFKKKSRNRHPDGKEKRFVVQEF